MKLGGLMYQRVTNGGVRSHGSGYVMLFHYPAVVL